MLHFEFVSRSRAFLSVDSYVQNYPFHCVAALASLKSIICILIPVVLEFLLAVELTSRAWTGTGPQAKENPQNKLHPNLFPLFYTQHSPRVSMLLITL